MSHFLAIAFTVMWLLSDAQMYRIVRMGMIYVWFVWGRDSYHPIHGHYKTVKYPFSKHIQHPSMCRSNPVRTRRTAPRPPPINTTNEMPRPHPTTTATTWRVRPPPIIIILIIIIIVIAIQIHAPPQHPDRSKRDRAVASSVNKRQQPQPPTRQLKHSNFLVRGIFRNSYWPGVVPLFNTSKFVGHAIQTKKKRKCTASCQLSFLVDILCSWNHSLFHVPGDLVHSSLSRACCCCSNTDKPTPADSTVATTKSATLVGMI